MANNEMKILNEQEVENVTSGGANGNFWQEGNVIYYRIAHRDPLA